MTTSTDVMGEGMTSLYHPNMGTELFNVTSRGGVIGHMEANGVGDFGPGELPICPDFRLWYYAVLLGSLCLLGVVGNTVSLLVLRLDREGFSPTILLLQALAVADNTVLVAAFFVLALSYGLLPIVLDYNLSQTIFFYAWKYVEPVAFMSHTATIWTTVLLALNRYIAICQPFRAKSFCTKRNTRIQIATVFICSFLYNFPRFFQWTIYQVEDDHTGEIHTAVNATVIGENTLFGKIYTNAMYSLLVVIMPLIFLCILNTRLIKEIRSMRNRTGAHGFSQINQDNMTTILIVIVVSVIVCHLPDRILQVMASMASESFLPCWECGCALYYIMAGCNLLIILNSSTNFVIYYLMRSSFRRILRKRMCGGGHDGSPYGDHFVTNATEASVVAKSRNGSLINGMNQIDQDMVANSPMLLQQSNDIKL